MSELEPFPHYIMETNDYESVQTLCPSPINPKSTCPKETYSLLHKLIYDTICDAATFSVSQHIKLLLSHSFISSTLQPQPSGSYYGFVSIPISKDKQLHSTKYPSYPQFSDLHHHLRHLPVPSTSPPVSPLSLQSTFQFFPLSPMSLCVHSRDQRLHL